jgi:hypothetical protein
MTVIVEPDSAAPWIGLAGVVVGGAITYGTGWLDGIRKRWRDKRADAIAAADELRGAAQTLLMIVGAHNLNRLVAMRGTKDIQAIAMQMERFQRAVETIRRTTTPALTMPAQQVAEAVFQPDETKDVADETVAAIRAFSEAFTAAGY